MFWDFTKPGVSSLPTSSSTNLRNTVSSSNLTLNNLSYAADNQTNQSSSSSSTAIPLVIPQKFQFNQPQAQPVMKSLGSTSSSSSTSTMVQQQQHHQQQQQQDEQLQMLCSRKNSLPHSSNLINNNNHTTNSNSSDLNNGVTKQNTKLNQTSTSSSSIQVANAAGTVESLLHHHQQDQQHQQQQQSQNGTNQCTDLQQQQQQSKSQTMKCPVVASPHQVMMLYMNKLTPYEHHEIYKYPHIYFIGANAKKRSGTGPNDYDNENGSYIHIPHDHIAYRYEVLKIIGKGSFGQVVKAYDHKTLEHVALKMVRNEKRFHRQAQEEIRILKHLRAQDKENTFNIIHM